MERRKGPDFINKWLKYAGVILWVLIAVYFFVADLARPIETTFFDRLFNVPRDNIWNYGLLMVAFIIAIILLVMSLASMMMNSRRLKRKGDRMRISVVLSFIISVISLTVLSIRMFL